MPPFSPAAVGRLAELEEVVLAREALPAFDADPGRIDAAAWTDSCRSRAPWCRSDAGQLGGSLVLDRSAIDLPGAIRIGAVDRARNAQVRRQRDLFEVLARNLPIVEVPHGG